MKTKATALLLSIAMTLSLLSGCGGSPKEKMEASSAHEQELTLSPETTAVTTNDGITAAITRFLDFVKSTRFSTTFLTPIAEIIP